MSKIEAGKFELNEEIFDLAEDASQALRFVKLQAERKGVSLGFAEIDEITEQCLKVARVRYAS